MKFLGPLALTCLLLPSSSLAAASPSKLKGSSSTKLKRSSTHSHRSETSWSATNENTGATGTTGSRKAASKRSLQEKKKAIAKGPDARECKASSKFSTSKDGVDAKQEVKFTCKATGRSASNEPTSRGISLDPGNLRDKIGYKVKTDKNGISVKIDYTAEYQEEEGVDEYTDSSTSFEVKFDSIIEYAKRDGSNSSERSDEDQAYNWDDDLILQRLELTEFLNFTNITQAGVLQFWQVETVDRKVLFNFTISQAAMGERVTANTMKIDVRIVNFPWIGNDTNLALISDVKSTLKVEMDYNEEATTARSNDLSIPAVGDENKTAPKVHKWARDVAISFEDATETLGYIPFGDYRWDEVADATMTDDPYGCGQVVSVQRNFPANYTSVCENWTATDDENVVEETDTIRVVGTYAPSMGNETHQQIAYSFVGPKAHRADVIYWDPEAGIGYEISGARGWPSCSVFMVSAILFSGLLPLSF